MELPTTVRRLWPDPEPEPLSGTALVAAYALPAPAASTRALVRVNFVTSVDGAVTVDGYSAGLSSPVDQRLMGVLRLHCDAVMVGAGTLRHEGYGPMRLPDQHRAWRREHGYAEDPALIVVSSRLDLDPSHPMLAAAPVRPTVVTHAASPVERRRALGAVADLLICGETVVDLSAVLAELPAYGIGRVLSEGGPHLFGALTAAGVVDEMCLTTAPLLAGPGADRITLGPAAPVSRLYLIHLLTSGSELFARYGRPTSQPPGPGLPGR